MTPLQNLRYWQRQLTIMRINRWLREYRFWWWMGRIAWHALFIMLMFTATRYAYERGFRSAVETLAPHLCLPHEPEDPST